MTRYLITGAAGFVGFHLASRLLQDGHDVVGFDGMTAYYDVRLKDARVDLLRRHPTFTLVTGMLEDRDALAAAADRATPDVIVHLAAQAGVRYSIEAPRTYVDSNLIGSWNVLDIARAVGCKHLLMASTSSVYGANESMPFRELDRADEPLSLYAATKKAMEAMAFSQSHLFGLPMTMFRFFTVYGPWGRPDMALFKFTDAILNGRPIDVYGQGEMARDFTYVEDLVEAIVRLAGVIPAKSNRVAAVDTLSKVAPFRVVNIAGGTPTPLMEFIETIEASLGRKAHRNMMAMQPGDVPRTYADPSLLRALTGYTPTTPVQDGVAAFVSWYRAYHA
ncbi:NAD-dependent epimerase/dehydratase family protein [Sphingomonas sp. Leaf38]|uniref:NAD-dependent epimerase/dehydratase family protein n=1 Tax=Sphingomonas sp. Leaf38 TaxID=1736217 RepID=UPI0006FC56B7|nr:NAD-dependent epimerase/dehydratase family protein [Sphingomonas sp. Leaf38]KQN29330.1 UDP-glucuronate 5-epimerase [Sphingomonas sp. Leaf38]